MDNNNKIIINLKLSFKGEIHRIQLNLADLTFTKLNQLFSETFPSLNEYLIQYYDDEDDLITIKNDIELMESCRVFLRLKITKTLFFHAKSLTCPYNNEYLKIKNSIDQFIIKLNNNMNQWIEKSKSIELKSKIDYLKQLSIQYQTETYNYLKENKNKLSLDKNYEKKFYEFTSNMHIRIQNVINDIKTCIINLKNDNKNDNTNEEEIKTEEIKKSEEIKREEEEEEKEEEKKKKDEEIVDEIIKDNRKWKNEYQSICEVFPECTYERAENFLERFNGDIHIVLNALMDL